MRLRAVCRSALLPLVAAAVLLGPGPALAEDPVGDPTATAEPTAQPTAEPTAEPTTDPMVGAPLAGKCSQMTYDDAMGETVSSETVPCIHQHTTEIVHVGTLPDGIGYDSEELWSAVFDGCRPEFEAHIPTDALVRARTLLRSYAFVPTAEQQEAGARWYRCDVGLVGHDKQAHSILITHREVLPRTHGDRVPKQVGRCVSRAMLLTLCSKNPAWYPTGTYFARDVSTRPKLQDKQLRRAAIQRCPSRTRTDRWVYSYVPHDKRTWVGICYSRN